MENACNQRGYGANEIFMDLLGTGTLGTRISISAEVESYAKYLEDKLQCAVSVVDFPATGETIPLPKATPYVIGAVGSGRPDKGYFRLFNIIDTHNRLYGSQRVKFRIQKMNPEDHCYDQQYEQRLANIKNVELLAYKLTEQEMRDQYARAHALLLPYCQETYRLRGSAIQAEAIASGRQLIASKNTGFEGMIKTLGNGIVCQTDREFAESIHTLTQQFHKYSGRVEIQAKEKYNELFKTALDSIFQRLREEE